MPELEKVLAAAKAVAELKNLWDDDRHDWHVTFHSNEGLNRFEALVAAVGELNG